MRTADVKVSDKRSGFSIVFRRRSTRPLKRFVRVLSDLADRASSGSFRLLSGLFSALPSARKKALQRRFSRPFRAVLEFSRTAQHIVRAYFLIPSNGIFRGALGGCGRSFGWVPTRYCQGGQPLLSSAHRRISTRAPQRRLLLFNPAGVPFGFPRAAQAACSMKSTRGTHRRRQRVDPSAFVPVFGLCARRRDRSGDEEEKHTQLGVRQG